LCRKEKTGTSGSPERGSIEGKAKTKSGTHRPVASKTPDCTPRANHEEPGADKNQAEKKQRCLMARIPRRTRLTSNPNTSAPTKKEDINHAEVFRDTAGAKELLT